MKKGNTLVEAVMSMSLLLISLTLSVQITSIASKSISIRKNKEKANRVSYAIENEIKYNISFIEIKRLLVGGKLSLDYKDNTLDYLLINSLSSLDRGEKIIIEKKLDHSVEDNYNISTFKITILWFKWRNIKWKGVY